MRARVVVATVLAMAAAGLATLTATAPAQAVQASGDNVVPWSAGWSWTYGNTSFNYNDGQGTNVTINESVTYTVAGQETFNGHDAYRLNISGSITGGSGDVSGSVNAHLDSFSGNVTGTRYVRRSDLALLQENQHQHLNAKAHVGIITQGITADIDLHLTPSPSWKIHDFPLNNGDSWHTLTDIAYTGGFTYDAGSLGGSGSSPFDGTLHFDANTTNTTPTINAMGNPNLPTDRSYAQNSDASQIEDSYWSPQYKNQVKEYMKIPMDGATLQINRNLTSATLSGGNTLTANATPSYTCAGNTVTVSGNLSTNAAGVGVTARLDQSQINPGQGTSASTTTGTNGAYSVTLPVPAQADGLARAGGQPSRANWGVLVTAPSASAVGATTVVVTPKDCSTIEYTGAVAGPQTGTATVSAKLTDLADANGAAGRTVTFSLSGGGSVNATTNSAGVASTTIAVTGPPRSATVTASFAGAANLEAASTSSSFSVTTIPTSTTVVANPAVAVVDDPVTFTATVAPGIGSGTPTGSVQFKVDGADFGAAVPLSGGPGGSTATSSPISTLPVAFHTVQAIYLGSADYTGSTSDSVQFRVRNPLLPTTTVQSVAPSSSVSGQAVTLSATVTKTSGSDPLTGSVTWTEGSTTLGSASLDGSGGASLTLTDLAVGTHNIVATYSGDDVYGGSASSPGSATVAKADVAVELQSSGDNTVTGEAVGFSATVSPVSPGAGTPTGTAQLVVDGNNVGTPVTLSAGVATFDPVATLGAGNHTVAVSYSGDARFKNGNDALTQHVTQASTTTTLLSGPSPQVEEEAVTMTATVAADAPGSGSPTGTVVFRADGDVIGSAPLSASGGSSQATFTTTLLAPGTHVLTATYGGDADYAGDVSDEVEQVVIEAAAIVATTTQLSSSKNPSTYGELVAFTATVAAADDSHPDGVVQFSIDGTPIGDPVPVAVDGTAESPTVSSPEPGDHLVIAAFSSEAAYAASGEALTQTVAAAPVTVDLTSSDADSDYGQGVTFHATVTSDQTGTGTPGGFVQFRVDGVALGNAVEVDEDGEATSPSVATLTPGTHTVTALYSGDAHFLPGTDQLSQGVGKIATTTTLAASSTSPTYGDAVTLTATVTPGSTAIGAPTGSVAFVEGGTTLATVPLAAVGTNGKASFTTSALTGGAHTIKAVYSGADAFAASTSATTTVNVAKRATSIKADAALLRLNPLLGINVGFLKATLTTSAGPLAGQPVVFTIGGKVACTDVTDGAGVATCDALSKLLQLTLANGYKASYAGDGNYLGSTDNGTLIK
ncbi:MAG: Ig-like domain repeat protein [Nocardioidaceae bacterium]|nr:Ig-like domain repeat protein [Nocardioidaceae bacterium]